MKAIMIAMAVMLGASAASAKTLVAYYSYTNNVERIVTERSVQIEADIIEIEPAEKGLDSAANNYDHCTELLNAIRANPVDASSNPSIHDVSIDVSLYDMVIIVTPLWWSHWVTPM